MHKNQARSSRYINNYGISFNDYTKLLKQQNRRCKICGLKKPLVVDHCHINGHVRGLLCTQCNSGLGFFKDTSEFLMSAITYLETTKQLPEVLQKKKVLTRMKKIQRLKEKKLLTKVEGSNTI